MSAVNVSVERHRPRVAETKDDRTQVRQGLKDVGDQALMRGLDTGVPNMRLGLTLSYSGHRPLACHKAFAGYSPAAVLPPPVRRGGGIVQVGRQHARPTT